MTANYVKKCSNVCRCGFTKVELIAVVAIVGLLVALSLPSFASVSSTEDLSDARSVYTACRMYLADNPEQSVRDIQNNCPLVNAYLGEDAEKYGWSILLADDPSNDDWFQININGTLYPTSSAEGLE